ncbi:MAG: stage III sporulation protein AG [Lachnospiraceae bacterium]|nr:stage III sporulation protein AG [Lachnospiraceae bacterium]
MEQMKKLTDKITGVKKLRKDQLLIMILSGILLCVIALPGKEKDTASSGDKSGISDRNFVTMEKGAQVQEESDSVLQTGAGDALSYTLYWEEKLTKSLSRIEGAGEVEVLITLKESEERVLEKDIPEQVSETAETDAEGGSRTISERRQEEATVYTVNEAGQNVPYVSKVIQPVIEGVVVIAQGGDSEIVKQNIIETIQVLFGIEANKIRVVKMKTNNN